MKKLVCINQKGKVISKDIYLANNFFERLVGLMFIKKEHKKSLLLKPTQSIHTCFMHFNIDAIFLNKDNVIVEIVKDLKPWRVTRFYWSAKSVLEVPSDEFCHVFSIGDKLEFKDV